MSDIAIRVEGLSKQYRLGSHERYKTLRDTWTDAMTAPFRAVANWRSRLDSPPSNDFIWALKDISLEIKHGEAVGIIGRNGAGKSTLLKILSRITEPTEGYAEIHGRIGSLLEVGTGFHPELTGRENIYLNGAILGMKRAEIDCKFDEIVAFAEIEKFLDTSVKHYSSGMHVRLAFAVAAHLEPEILLVDEVLSVGDAVFQKKCLGKMEDVASEGRTVLFVSHNLGALANLCPRAVLLVQGKKWRDGASDSVISEYVAMSSPYHGEIVWDAPATAPGNEKMRLHAVRIVSGGQTTAEVDIQQDVHIEVEFWNYKPGAMINTSIHLLDKMGTPVLASSNARSANLIEDPWFGKPYSAGLYRAVCTLPGNFLNEGLYGVNAIVLTDITNIEISAREVLSFTVHDTGAMRKEYQGIWIGVVRPKLAWQTEYLRSVTTIDREEKNL
jgi:lipopolysaccharide transport system ATP-binding protein